ncbi:hypothetical protein RC083_00555 [Pseudoalteromonas haloplanktis]|uniref:DUF304 domain-containing protein n=1 Tax=Pseudoalteromonas haloplanktis TaxID=228 RepID=A0ABU1B8U5_PSEHA|nr:MULTISPECIES: hypothetical protein [Pseudoalteromonas]MDQ9090072.1 hypothetical protein [Pseudoalteromonas haloplanktis]TMN72770.1 hypothetical protein CWB85_05765 [Pseudoalteromonas sp. S1727]
MFANLTNKQKRRSLLTLAVIFFILGIYQSTASTNGMPMLVFSNGFIIAIAFWAFSRRYSEKFIKQHALVNAITRVNNQLVIKQAPIKKIAEVDITRVSQITISDNYLSCILDGNGQGFDFQLIGKAGEINTQVNSILTVNEQQTITITVV